MSLTTITFDHVLVSVSVAHVWELLDISSGDLGSSPTWHTLPWNYLTHSHLGPPDTLTCNPGGSTTFMLKNRRNFHQNAPSSGCLSCWGSVLESSVWLLRWGVLWERLSADWVHSLTHSFRTTVCENGWLGMSALIHSHPFSQTVIPTHPFIPNDCLCESMAAN